MYITYINNLSAKDYNMLRASAGWREIHPEQAARGLNGSAFIVAAMDRDKTVGCARLIFDGGYMAIISDVLVLPEYRRCGIGSAMMTRIFDYLKTLIKPGYSIHVNLMASKGKEGFYEKFGFSVRPRENRGAGMDMWL